MYKTYDEWKALGRQVRKGEKSVRRHENGPALFERAQTDVYKYTKHTGRPVSAGEHPDPWVDYEDGIWGPEDEVAMDYY